MDKRHVAPALAGAATNRAVRWLAAAPACAGATMLLLGLAGCGKQADLRPATGQALPVKAATSPRQATVDDLLQRPPRARPQRIDDVLRKSEERREDRFDLPPAG